MRKDERRPKGQVLKPSFTSKLFKELLEGLREQKNLVNYLNKDLGIGWRNLSLKQLRDVPLSILMRIILNYSYMWDREKFIAAGATLAARICGYHWVVLKDGTIQAGRPETMAGAHLRHYNQHAICICYVRGLDKNGKSADTRTPEQKAALHFLLKDLKEAYPQAKICGHRDFPHVAKDCPCFDAAECYADLNAMFN